MPGSLPTHNLNPEAVHDPVSTSLSDFAFCQKNPTVFSVFEKLLSAVCSFIGTMGEYLIWERTLETLVLWTLILVNLI